jgi:Ca-activated chloride channel homolog
VDNKKLSHKKIPSHNFFVAFDISRSMELEDYVPNRLNVVKKGVKNFLQSRGACDVGVIYFGGNAKFLMRGESECFATESLDTLSFYHVKPGSAMGKAVWLAANSIKKNNSPNKIVIISDGDNTFGVFTPSLIVALARQHNMKIYTIGIGSIGLVPFGKDDTAQPRLYDNTFSDVYLKELSAETGGTYTFAKNAAEITTILANIFSK